MNAIYIYIFDHGALDQHVVVDMFIMLHLETCGTFNRHNAMLHNLSRPVGEREDIRPIPHR